MKKFVAALFTVALSAASASAADMAARYAKAPPVAPAYNWTGFYVGLNAGGAWNESNPTTTTVFSPVGYFAPTSPAAVALAGNLNIDKSGFTGGVTAGYNWQINNAVLGVETDFNYFGIKGSSTGTTVYPCCAPDTFTVNSSESTDWLWTLRGRAGFLATPALLLYGTGGLAVANVKASYLFTDTFGASESASISTTRYGWTAGVGGEYALMNGWSIKAEYLYVDLGRASTTSTNLMASYGPVPATVFTHTVDLRSNIGRVGVNYKFGGPVVAKY